jgi:hypothetical protein
VFQKKILVVMVTLGRNRGYISTLVVRNKVRATIEAFTFLRKGITKIEVKFNFFQNLKLLDHQTT